MKLRLVVGLMLLSTALAGCASGGGPAASAAGNVSSVVMSVGGSAPYTLYTHCGVISATINGSIFYAEPALTDGSGNPPSGWGNPYDSGEMRADESRDRGIPRLCRQLATFHQIGAGPGSRDLLVKRPL